MATAHVGDISIAYQLRGEGPPLIMFAGYRRSSVIWGEAFLRLLEPHFTMVLPDNRGTGDSARPAGGYSIEAFADDGAAVLEDAGIPAAFVFGVSMGGMITQRFATRHPARTRAIAIGCSHAGGGSVAPVGEEVWTLLRLLPNADMDAREVARRQEAAYYTDAFRAANRELFDAQFEAVNRNPTPEHAVKGHMAAIEAFDGVADLGQIAAPTLVITGDSDRLMVPENSRSMAQRIPGAELCVLEDSAHFFWIDHPEETARALTGFFTKVGG